MAYCNKFKSNLSPDQIGCVMLLHYARGLSQTEKDKLRDDLYRNHKHATIYIGRMGLIENSKPRGLPHSAWNIYKRVKLNCVVIFGPPCSGWWYQMVQTIKHLALYQKKNLVVDEFFAGYTRLLVDDIFKYLEPSVCPNPKHHDLEHLQLESRPVPEYQTVHSESLLVLGGVSTLGKREDALEKPVIWENYGDLLEALDRPEAWNTNVEKLQAQKLLQRKLSATVSLLLKPSYSCVSLETARVLLDMGQMQFIRTSFRNVFKALAEEWIMKIIHFEDSAGTMNFLIEWEGGFLKRCTSLFETIPDADDRICRILHDCMIALAGPEFSSRLLEFILSSSSDHQLLLRRITSFLGSLGGDVYMDMFEEPFFDKITSLSFEDLLALIRDSDVLDSWSSYLVDRTTHLKFISILRKVLLDNMSDLLVEYLLEGSVNEDLPSTLVRIPTVFKALSRSPIGSEVCNLWAQQCVDCCFSTFNVDPSRHSEPVKLMEEIINVLGNCNHVVKSYLHGDHGLLQYLNSCLSLLLSGNDRYPEYISLFIDAKVSKGSEDASALEAVSDLVVVLANKDIFEGFYLKHLPKRLIYAQSSLDLEIVMISKLRALTSPEFVCKVDSLIANALSSVLVMQSFQNASTSNAQALSAVCFDCTRGTSPARCCGN